MSHRQLSASGLHVSYDDRRVLVDAGLVVPRGGRVALLGANGSGKTTLLRCLSGAVRPDAGSIAVDGVPLRHDRSGLRQHRQVVQLVAQDPDDQLFAADVFRDVSFGPMNLGLPEVEVRRRVGEALDVLSIADLAERPIHQLSFGQRKRVAIAGALAMHPCIMLLDEPTAGLDPHGVDEMVDALERLLAAHTTVVIATHDVDFALAWADTVAVLHDGTLRHGDPVELLGDAELVGAARLRRPAVLRILAGLGIDGDGVRDVPQLVDLLSRPAPRVAGW